MIGLFNNMLKSKRTHLLRHFSTSDKQVQIGDKFPSAVVAIVKYDA